MPMLASDLANPEFVNPQNPDSQLFVEFFWHEPPGPAPQVASIPQGRLPKTPYVRIMAPGNDKSVIETAVREDHKARWPQKWLAWQMKEGLIEGAARDVPGWKLSEWNELNEGQVRELDYLRFTTVEQLAGASDAQVQRLGMGGVGLRARAQTALKNRITDAIREATAKQAEEIQALRDRDAAREKEMQEMRELVAKLAAAPQADEKRKPGRPRKERESPLDV